MRKLTDITISKFVVLEVFCSHDSISALFVHGVFGALCSVIQHLQNFGGLELSF